MVDVPFRASVRVTSGSWGLNVTSAKSRRAANTELALRRTNATAKQDTPASCATETSPPVRARTPVSTGAAASTECLATLSTSASVRLASPANIASNHRNLRAPAKMEVYAVPMERAASVRRGSRAKRAARS